MLGFFSNHLNDILPAPRDGEAASRFWNDLPPEAQRDFVPNRAWLEAVAAGSPYLRLLMLHHRDVVSGFLEGDSESLFTSLMAGIASASLGEEQAVVMAALRQGKARSALLIALCDLAGVWTVDQVTAHLTTMADTMLQATVNWLLRDAARAGKMHLADAADPAYHSGYVALAMGKHGAVELNYSSDIDLIILYDAETAPVTAGTEPATFFVRLTKRLVTLLQDATEDGYGLRVDLRLRPDPRATQVAISLEAAAIYYESMGQNWERAAMIKARPAAGDLALGAEFLQRMKPYIWRKYLDFAAIADVQSLKRQIHAVKGHGSIAILGHNIKLGRGGIREIEFFVQTQQLIAGGRNPSLRGLRTLDMLDALAAANWIAPEAANELKSAYRFLRKIEHRIQMVNDEQTHLLPAQEEAFESLARFSGFSTGEAFAQTLRTTFETVQKHYAALFEDADELASDAGSLVFTGGEDDPETLETLARMGFHSGSEISATIRGWHFGRYAATRSAKAKELLTELMPQLLAALARSGDADAAFLSFDRFIAGLPAGVQLFSMLKANPSLLDLIATILGSAPRLAQQLSARPRVLDAVLDPGFFDALPRAEDLAAMTEAIIPADLPLEEVVDRVRIIGREQMFRVGVRVLAETVNAGEAGLAFSNIAERLLQRLHQAVTMDIEQRHGRVPGGRSCIVAMGKLGGREMTATSDLDLMLIYDHAPGAEISDGAKPLSIGQYYARFAQRFIAAITAPTGEGTLYEVDMRLRPSGNKGPVATSLDSFCHYQQNSAWTWEKLALTRARVVAGDASLAAAMGHAIAASLCAARDPATTRSDVQSMRQLMVKEQGSQGLWDLKRCRGGLVEIEFIAQYLQLIQAPQHPQVLSTNTFSALQNLSTLEALTTSAAQELKDACQLYQRLTQVLRLCVEGAYDPHHAPAGLNEMVCRAAEVPNISAAESLLTDVQARVAQWFSALIGPV
jgi:glutamate-ammonia-ligase adenylyltransferase